MERLPPSPDPPPSASPLKTVSPIDQPLSPTRPRITQLLTDTQQSHELTGVVRGLLALGIDPAPERNAFIRNYPPLRELPLIEKPVKVDLRNVRGDLALFLYIPFCTGKCSYCFYPKTIDAPEEAVDDYIETLRGEIALFRETIPSTISSIYVGGGTPSYLSAAQIERLLGNLDVPRDEAASMTCEVSPETLTEEKIAVLQRCGVTRISMGVQSLDDGVLKATGRRYDAEDAKEKIRLLAGNIGSYNLDFIYGLEGQGIEDVDNMLRLIRELQPSSVTFYQRWTGMRDQFVPSRREVVIGSISDMLSARALIEETMAGNGYERDSLFRYVQKQKDGCSYCRTVWADNSCVAAGISAYSSMNGAVSQNTYSMREYREKVRSGFAPIRRAKQLSAEEQATRALVLGLKTAGENCTLNVEAIERKYGVTCTPELAQLLTALENLGMLEVQEGSVSFTPLGIAFSEQILGKLMECIRFSKESGDQ